MDRETEAAPRQAPPANGLPPIFQRPTYPSGEPATKAPERAPEEPSEPRAPREPRQRRERTEDERADDRTPASRPPRSRTAATEEAPAKRRTGSSETGDGTSATPGEIDAPAPRRRSRGGRGRGGRGRGGGRTTTRDDATVEAAEARPARTRTDPDDGAEDGRPRRQGGRGRSAAEKEPEQSPESQRDDAQPDGAGIAAASGEETDVTDAPKRRRRRGGRGRKRSGAADGTEAPARPERPARQEQERQERSERSRGPKTLEEQVASGGPTRGLRSRTLRGRSGRRQRAPQIVPPRFTDQLMVITEHGERGEIAVLEENTLVQPYVTRRGSHSMVGNVYLGRIQNVLPRMEAAFVDIGRGRNGVLYAGEVNYSPEDLEGGRPPRIERVLKSGQAVMVQVTKDPMGGKGARLTAQISLPGRFLVLASDQDVSGISRRLSDEARKRLKSILNKVKPKAHG